jgi:hypothetical protein
MQIQENPEVEPRPEEDADPTNGPSQITGTPEEVAEAPPAAAMQNLEGEVETQQALQTDRGAAAGTFIHPAAEVVENSNLAAPSEEGPAPSPPMPRASDYRVMQKKVAETKQMLGKQSRMIEQQNRLWGQNAEMVEGMVAKQGRLVDAVNRLVGLLRDGGLRQSNGIGPFRVVVEKMEP